MKKKRRNNSQTDSRDEAAKVRDALYGRPVPDDFEIHDNFDIVTGGPEGARWADPVAVPAKEVETLPRTAGVQTFYAAPSPYHREST